jgi:hypothetical protein
MFRATRRVSLVLFACLLFGSDPALAQTVSAPARIVNYPDLIIHNAKIVTMDDQDPVGGSARSGAVGATRR